MSGIDPDRLVNAFVAGRLSRRELILRLMAIGAATTGAGTLARAASSDENAGDNAGDNADEPTFTGKFIDHLALNVTDIPRSRAWYVRHLGMSVMHESRTTCFLRCANGRDFLALFRSDEPGMHHFSFGIEQYDQDDADRRLREAGLTPKPRGRRMYFDDPDGLEVQVSQA